MGQRPAAQRRRVVLAYQRRLYRPRLVKQRDRSREITLFVSCLRCGEIAIFQIAQVEVASTETPGQQEDDHKQDQPDFLSFAAAAACCLCRHINPPA